MVLIFIGILGWLVGLTVNYLADVLPIKRKFTQPVCVHCFKEQPVGKYLFWPRRCLDCHLYRPFRTWVVEAFFIASSLWLWIYPQDELGFFLGLLLLVFFAVVVVIDLEHKLILHPVSWAGAVLCLGIGWYLHDLVPTFVGGVSGYLIMLGLYYFGDLFGRWLARRRGEILTEVALGYGDVNLAGVLGLLLGWPGIVAGLILAIFIGGIVSLIYLLWMIITRKYQAFTAIPYGPFLIASALLLVFFKDFISQIY